MTVDRRLLEEYPFDGVFYEYRTDTSEGLLNQKTEEVEVLRTKCDIQQTSQIGNAGFLASSYTIYFPLESNDSLLGSPSDEADGGIGEVPSDKELVDDKAFKPIAIKRGMYFRGTIYGYEVNGKVIGVAPSMLGGCACQIKDLDE
ncbi:MAG: hypothetical protein KBT34_02905 [Prevotella sp.]|nr:hypothetical protein [Candidatus Prevotella equi]